MSKQPILKAMVCGLASVAAAAAFAADPRAAAAAAPTAAAAAAPTLSPAGEGRRLYVKLNCSGCHGARAGGGGMGPKIAGQEAHDVFEKMQKGESAGMPAYPAEYVTTSNAAYLGAYLRSIGTPSEPRFVDWWVPFPTK
jgi:mono/diheme cytochrome c family protein